MRRSVAWNGCYGQPHQPATNYHRTHSDHATMVAERPPPCHAGGGAVQHHVVVHKETFDEEVDGGQQGHRHFHNHRHVKPQTKPMAMMVNHHAHGGAGSHRYEAFQETFEEETSYSAGRRDEYQTYEETYEEEVVVGGGGAAQLQRGCRGA